MRDDVTMQRHLSLAGRMHRMIHAVLQLYYTVTPPIQPKMVYVMSGVPYPGSAADKSPLGQ